MFVNDYMLLKENVIVLEPEISLKEALEKLEDKNYLSLPVVHNGNYKGILNKNDIYKNYFNVELDDRNKYLLDTKVKEIIKPDLNCIKENELIENAFYILKRIKTHYLAVIDNCDSFVGILTHKLVFNALANDYGLNSGEIIGLLLHNNPKELSRLIQIITKEGANIVNLSVKDSNLINILKVIIKVENCNIEMLISKLESDGFKIASFCNCI